MLEIQILRSFINLALVPLLEKNLKPIDLHCRTNAPLKQLKDESNGLAEIKHNTSISYPH